MPTEGPKATALGQDPSSPERFALGSVSPSRGEKGACYARRRSETVEGGRGELAQRGQDPSSPERFALGCVSPSREEKGACYGAAYLPTTGAGALRRSKAAGANWLNAVKTPLRLSASRLALSPLREGRRAFPEGRGSRGRGARRTQRGQDPSSPERLALSPLREGRRARATGAGALRPAP